MLELRLRYLHFAIGVCILGLGHLPTFSIATLPTFSFATSVMPPKNTRKAKENGEETESEDHMVASPSVSEASYASSISSAPTALSFSTEMLESILASRDKSMMTMFASLVPAPTVAVTTPPPPPPPRAQVKVPKWSDEEIPSAYFSKYEKALTLNGVPRSQWGQNIHVHLSGKAQDALPQVPSTSLDDYDVIKATVLDALGDTPSTADRNWWSIVRKAGEDACAFYLRIRACGIMRLQGLISKEEILEKLVLSRFLSLLSADSYAHTTDRNPKDGLEAAKIVHELEERRAYTRERSGWRQDHRRHNPHSSRREPNSSDRTSPSSGNGSGNSGSTSSNSTSGAGVKEVTGSNPSSGTSASGGSRSSNSSGAHSSNTRRKPVVCHNCGEPGHIRPNCPNRVRSVRSPEHDSLIEVDGALAGTPLSGLQIDTGASRSVVSAKWVPKTAYLKKSITLDSWRGKQLSKHQLAKIKITVGNVSVDAVVAVAEQLDCPALLGMDLGADMTVKLTGIVFDKAKAAQVASEVNNVVPMQIEVNNEVPKQDVIVDPVRVTRAQAKQAAAEEHADDLASAQAESQPISLEDIFSLPDSYFETEEAHDAVVTPLEEAVEWPEADRVELPMPALTGDVAKLREEQKADSTLGELWKKGEKTERGYTFDNGILVHHTSDGIDDSVVRVVVPSCRRQQVLRLAHSSSIAGHFGVKKTHAKISLHFVWPGLWTQVKEYVRSCVGCQLAAKQHKARAPLQPLPCVGEPFHKVAFDLVGPLPRTTSGYKYLLTAMCLYTKYPDAIPLKKVDNHSVLDAMMQIFSQYGMPSELLTDQGSVFTSKLTALMCQTFNIVKIRTSPYHPQSDGALERWHACLKGMVKRSDGKLCEWDKQLKYILFAYRDTPHCVTGFSPFSLMFGRDVRGPLHFLKNSWLEGEVDVCLVGDWLASVKAKMWEMSEIVSDREVKAKASMKSFYDRSASVKTFKEGDMVLMKKPIMVGKLEGAWTGPFEIERCVSPVTYALKLPGRSNKAKVIHCNLLKEWHTPADVLHRVMVVGDVESESESSPGLRLGRADFVPSSAEQAMLDSVLLKYKDVLCPTPGRTEAAQLCIRTGDSEPVRSHPYRIPPKWKEEVKTQLDQLLALGIIEPSTSPWSSSLVIVSKKDGGVRTCVDYRAVNAVTDPDPYQMPLIEEILDMLSTAVFISKVDLNKGFHQIPILEEDCPKTSFCTPWGKFQYRYMPFGLRNGPAVFQRLMDNLLHRDKEYSQVYIDDIAIFSATWEEHCQQIDVVLGRLKQAGLTAKVTKCQWAQTQVEFLGHIVGKGKVSPAELKVKAVADFQLPKTKKGVRQFLGLTGYYRRFIPNFAEHSFHLTEATRKTAPDRIMFSDALNDEFLYLKSVLCSVPTLTLPVPADSFVLQTDASGVGLGAVLSVVREDVEYPVAFYSKKLLPRERQYSASELEALAVVVAVGHFEAYLITHPFTIVTDHRALTFLNSAQHRNGRLARWAIKLQPFTFSIRYRPGSQHINADVLSRMFTDDPQEILPPSGMPEAPTSSETFGHTEGGGDVMESPSPAAAAP